MKRREVKRKGEKKRHTYLKAEFQRIARRDKKAFLSDQCKEIEEICSRKSETSGNIACKDGLDKGQKWYGSNRSRDIKKRWQEYTEELYKKDLHNLDNHDGVITHLEPDILECEVKWA